jgi:acetyl esterase
MAELREETLEAGIRELVESFIAQGRPSLKLQTMAARREGYRDSVVLAGDEQAVYRIEEHSLDGIGLRCYRPSEATGLPVVVYFHGGCFVSGDFDTHDRQLRTLANLSGALVVAVEYRLAPEHTYPAAHDDAYLAAQLVRNHCSEWGGDAENIVLVGDSAGGHLCLLPPLSWGDPRLLSARRHQPVGPGVTGAGGPDHSVWQAVSRHSSVS